MPYFWDKPACFAASVPARSNGVGQPIGNSIMGILGDGPSPYSPAAAMAEALARN
jgi:hypothetical protein